MTLLGDIEEVEYEFVKILVIAKHALLDSVLELRPANLLVAIVVEHVEQAFYTSWGPKTTHLREDQED